MNNKIKYKEVEKIEEFIDAIRIRVDVFIKEQKCEPGWEPDEKDKKSMHFIAITGNKIVATARARETRKNEYKIERMATKKEYRKKGIGKGLVECIIKNISKQKPKRIWMQSQVRAQRFYETCGFKTISKPYNLYGIKHIDMELE
ncbi:GNAT family N-acetyltransferase [Candidatus Woesearchaeota archaeon]|nr:GNAT family N-acetyltransferase [Candidatus Woesearchaeota archaeon]